MSLTRQQRRAQERADLKAARRAHYQPTITVAVPAEPPVVNGTAARSCRNTLVGGVTSPFSVHCAENQAEFDSLLERLLAEYAPQSVTETMYVEELAQQWWLLQRARRTETTFFATYRHDSPNFEKRAAALSRDCARHERGFHRCVSVLRSMQKSRGVAGIQPAVQEQPAPAANPLKSAVSAASSSPADSGSSQQPGPTKLDSDTPELNPSPLTSHVSAQINSGEGNPASQPAASAV